MQRTLDFESDSVPAQRDPARTGTLRLRLDISALHSDYCVATIEACQDLESGTPLNWMKLPVSEQERLLTAVRDFIDQPEICELAWQEYLEESAERADEAAREEQT